MPSAAPRGLARLARLHGVQTGYRDADGHQRRAGAEALIAVLAEFGIEASTERAIRTAFRERAQARATEVLPPAAAAWTGRPAHVSITLPAGSHGVLACTISREDGEVHTWHADTATLAIEQAEEEVGFPFRTYALPLPGDLPPGYHELTVEVGGEQHTARIIAAAPRVAAPKRGWGVFAPAYAYQTARSWGAGDLTDLAELVDLVTEQGASVIGTLPLLAAYLGEEPYEFSPYAPVSRRYWNEWFLDPGGTAEPGDELARLRADPLVDYRATMALKRPVLEAQAEEAFDGGEPREAAFRTYLADHPELESYARFRATVERQGAGWQAWPRALQERGPQPGDYDEAAMRYHCYAQWRTATQIQEVAGRASERGAQLYLDLPIGVHRDGFDVWLEQDLFALETSAGAPPDTLFTGGQNWGFPPLKPEALRQQGYRHLILTLRHHLEVSGMLRIDHVMGLHRLFWVPEGMPATEGVYVRYPAEELYAVHCLEAQRHDAVLVGEDLGTVPQAVRSAMGRHGMQRMFVAQFALSADPEAAIGTAPRDTVASLNTHDLPTFAGYLTASDIDLQLELDLIDEPTAREAREGRAAVGGALEAYLHHEGRLAANDGAPADLAVATLEELAAGPARTVLVNLEDLWGETAPQNVPGTWREKPNWRRKAAVLLDDPTERQRINDALGRVARARSTGGTT